MPVLAFSWTITTSINTRTCQRAAKCEATMVQALLRSNCRPNRGVTVSVEDRTDYSLWLDIRIILRKQLAVMWGNGAFKGPSSALG